MKWAEICHYRLETRIKEPGQSLKFARTQVTSARQTEEVPRGKTQVLKKRERLKNQDWGCHLEKCHFIFQSLFFKLQRDLRVAWPASGALLANRVDKEEKMLKIPARAPSKTIPTPTTNRFWDTYLGEQRDIFVLKLYVSGHHTGSWRLLEVRRIPNGAYRLEWKNLSLQFPPGYFLDSSPHVSMWNRPWSHQGLWVLVGGRLGVLIC